MMARRRYARHAGGKKLAALYEAKRQAGDLGFDPAQYALLAQAASGMQGWRWKARLRRCGIRLAGRHLYIHGEVGRGKSMLMDMILEAAPFTAKRRLHFHHFMDGIHRQLAKRHIEGTREGADKGLEKLCADFCRSHALLALDEVYIADIGDAMLVGQLFRLLHRYGLTLVMTSNFAPQALYTGGVNREIFVPFLLFLEEKSHILRLEGDKDHRLQNGVSRYLWPANDTNRQRFAAMRAKAGVRPEACSPLELRIFARRVRLGERNGRIVSATFAELCASPRAKSEYIALARRCDHLFLSGVRLLQKAERDTAVRLRVLVDVLYDAGATMTSLGEVPIEAIYGRLAGFVPERVAERTRSRLEAMHREPAP